MPTASSYLCGCGRFMRVKRNSVTVEELLEDGSPYKLWDADLLECVECGVELIAGFGRLPIAEHWQPTYAAQRARLAPIYPGRCRPVGDTGAAGQLARAVAARVAAHYPPDWPKCSCGLPVMDGHLTCGKLECDEAGARAAREGRDAS